MLLSQAQGLVTTAPITPVVVLIDPAPWGVGGIQKGWGASSSRDFGPQSDFHFGYNSVGPWGRPQGGGWQDGQNAWSQTNSNSDATNSASTSMATPPGGFGTTFGGVGPNAAPTGLAPMTATPPGSPDPSASASGPAAADGNAVATGRGPVGPTGPMFVRPREFAAASLAALPMGAAPSTPAPTSNPQAMGNLAATPGPNPGDPPPPPGPNPAAMAAGAGAPSTAQPLAEPGGAWTATATVSVVGSPGPATVTQTSVNTHDATKALVAGVPNSTPATIAIQAGIGMPAGTTDGRGEAGDSQTAPNLEAAAPQAAGVLTAFMPLDPKTIEASLEKLLERIDALGAPIAGSQDRLPIIVPVAVALAAMETARRRLGKTSTPGPVVGRGSRLSSLRGLS